MAAGISKNVLLRAAAESIGKQNLYVCVVGEVLDTRAVKNLDFPERLELCNGLLAGYRAKDAECIVNAVEQYYRGYDFNGEFGGDLYEALINYSEAFRDTVEVCLNKHIEYLTKRIAQGD